MIRKVGATLTLYIDTDERVNRDAVTELLETLAGSVIDADSSVVDDVIVESLEVEPQ